MLIKDALKGKTVVCVASGPSLTIEQIDYIKRKADYIFVCNSAFKDFVEEADILFSYDVKWYRFYNEELKTFKGLKLCKDLVAEVEGLASSLNRESWFKEYGNSGATLLKVVSYLNPEKILLVGYDCKVSDKSHYHGDHPKPLTNCVRIEQWPGDFKRLVLDEPSLLLKVYNCSLDSDLHIFKRGDLFELL